MTGHDTSAYMDSDKRAYRTEDVDVSKLKRAKDDGTQLKLHGVDHTARPCTGSYAKLVEFYRDVLGLPLIHTISARGWGQPGHPDFLHFFFERRQRRDYRFLLLSGNRQAGEVCVRRPSFLCRYPHCLGRRKPRRIAKVERYAGGARCEGVAVHVTRSLESIYFRDPNGYP